MGGGERAPDERSAGAVPAGSLAEEGGGVVSGDHSGDHRGPFFLFVRSRRARDLSPHTDDTLPLARFAGAASFSLRDHADTRPPPALHAARTVQRQVTGAGMWRRTGETPGRGQHPAPTPLTASHTHSPSPRAPCPMWPRSKTPLWAALWPCWRGRLSLHQCVATTRPAPSAPARAAAAALRARRLPPTPRPTRWTGRRLLLRPGGGPSGMC